MSRLSTAFVPWLPLSGMPCHVLITTLLDIASSAWPCVEVKPLSRAQSLEEEARPWFERAVAEAELGDVHGRINHESLGIGLHQVGYCLSSSGRYAEARPPYERAVAEKERGDVYRRLDHKSLATTLSAGAHCLRKLGESDLAREWEQKAAEAKR